ncbi:MAG TPA: ABC transporter permease [Acidimicrobiia bacterium]|nr:ABC transporter permease [Acidimicrobiia bacterium]
MLEAYDGHAWVDWSWVGDHLHEINARLEEHAILLGWSILLALIVAVPLALVSVRRPHVYGSVIVSTGVLYTIPSLAAFALLLPYTGLSHLTAIIPLAAYSLLILVRNMVTGLREVPADVQDAAIGLGYSPREKLWRVDMPLALPTIIAGLRIAVVTVIGLIPVSALIGQGGLGLLMTDGFQRDFRTPLVVGIVLTVVFAVVADALLLGLQKAVTPWARRRARA